MTPEEGLQTIRHELEAGIKLTKCQQCGCMEDTLKQLTSVLPTIGTHDASTLADHVSDALTNMRPVQYACLGCEHCYPAVASNALGLAFPALDQLIDVACDFRVNETQWPPVIGNTWSWRTMPYFPIPYRLTQSVSTLGYLTSCNILLRVATC